MMFMASRQTYCTSVRRARMDGRSRMEIDICALIQLLPDQTAHYLRCERDVKRIWIMSPTSGIRPCSSFPRCLFIFFLSIRGLVRLTRPAISDLTTPGRGVLSALFSCLLSPTMLRSNSRDSLPRGCRVRRLDGPLGDASRARSVYKHEDFESRCAAKLDEVLHLWIGYIYISIYPGIEIFR